MRAEVANERSHDDIGDGARRMARWLGWQLELSVS
jgi:hypothetical protein